ncbi:hypothetical protein EUX98_g5805 [Antrodiella citrinella]|uniref:Uncharacterized protein n=1 Tax=Antrodiella citrinella TaxID=2447956 RepID=A0A4S4MSF1_9APHY|nr:hypothetical protein EUX98_g5805 [Antrodiella citrinella]
MSRGTRSQHGDPEKDHHEYVQEEPRRSEAGVLDITAKSAEDTEDGEVEEVDLNGRPLHRKGRIASQNSDGSFAIELPQLPDRGHVRASASSAELLPPSRDSPPPPSPIVFHGSRGILLSDVEGVRDEAGGLPQIETISPLRVNFQDVPPREDMRQDRPASEGAASIPTSLKIALFGHERSAEASTAAPATPTTPAGDPHLSFLDMESSTSTSIKSSARSARQSASGSTKSSSNPRADNASTYYAILPPPPNRKSLALSMSMGPGPTSSRPSLSPSISLQPIPMSPETIQRPALSIPEDALTSSDKGDERAGQLEFIPSPTDSLPLTVSDIHFRHSSYSTVSQPSESRRASAANRSSGSQRLPHPPLPLGPENKPFIVQKLLGMHGTPPTPYSSPTTPQFGVAGPSHRRAGSAGVVSPMSPGFFIPTRDPTGRTK